MSHSCHVSPDGIVGCRGENGAGQLGNRSAADSPALVGTGLDHVISQIGGRFTGRSGIGGREPVTCSIGVGFSLFNCPGG